MTETEWKSHEAMSQLTDVVIHLNAGSDFPTPERTALLQPFAGHTGLTQLDTENIIGDRKGFCDDIYAGVFNHLNWDDLRDFLVAIPWEADTTVVVSIRGEAGQSMIMSKHWGGAWETHP